MRLSLNVALKELGLEAEAPHGFYNAKRASATAKAHSASVKIQAVRSSGQSLQEDTRSPVLRQSPRPPQSRIGPKNSSHSPVPAAQRRLQPSPPSASNGHTTTSPTPTQGAKYRKSRGFGTFGDCIRSLECHPLKDRANRHQRQRADRRALTTPKFLSCSHCPRET